MKSTDRTTAGILSCVLMATLSLLGSQRAGSYQFSDWLLEHQVDPSVWLPQQSAAGDDTPNFSRYAFRAAPDADPAGFMPRPEVSTSRGVPLLSLKFEPIQEIEGVTFDVEVTSDLENWLRGPDHVEAREEDGSLTFVDLFSGNPDARFMRFLVEADKSLDNITFVNPEIENQVRNQLAQTLPELADPRIPLTLSVLPMVKELKLEFSEDHPVLQDLFFLPGLKELVISGKGQEMYLQSLGRMDGLQTLVLGGVVPTDFSFLGGLPNLLDLTMTGDGITTVALGHLVADGLERLVLAGSEVDDIAALTNLENLEILNLNHTQVSDLTPLAGLSSLRVFSARNTPLGDLTPLNSHVNLESLDLRDTTVTSIFPLTDLVNLQVLNLHGSTVSNIGNVWRMTSLTTIDLFNASQLSNIAPLEFAPVINIDIRGTAVDWCSADTALIVGSIQSQGRNIQFEACDDPYQVAVKFVAGPDIFGENDLIDLELLVSDADGARVESPLFLDLDYFYNLEGTATLTPTACQGGGWRFSPATVTLDAPPAGGMVTFEVSRVHAIEGRFVDPDFNPIPDMEVAFTDLSTDETFFEITDAAGRFINGNYPGERQLSITIGTTEWVLSGPLAAQTPFAYCSPIVLQPAPEPATSKIAFFDGNILFTVDPDGSNRQQAATGAGTVPPSLARWAPDGNSILFTGQTGGLTNNLRRVDVATGNLTAIYQDSDLSVYDGVESPDGTIILSARNVTTGTVANNPTLLYRRTSGGSSWNGFLQTSPLWKNGTRYTRDGTRIVFAAADDTDSGPGTYRIHTANANGTGVSGAIVNGNSPAWDSTGDRIVYRTNSGEIRIRDLDASTTIILTAGESPSWSPDDEWIAFSHDGNVYKARSDGSGSPVFITEGERPDWSPAFQ